VGEERTSSKLSIYFHISFSTLQFFFLELLHHTSSYLFPSLPLTLLSLLLVYLLMPICFLCLFYLCFSVSPFFVSFSLSLSIYLFLSLSLSLSHTQTHTTLLYLSYFFLFLSLSVHLFSYLTFRFEKTSTFLFGRLEKNIKKCNKS